jgi:hypothetical protein
MKLSVDFAFEGFRIIRHRPGVIPIWGLFLLIGFGLAYGLFFGMAWQPFMEFIELAQRGGTPDPMAIMTLYAKIGPAYLLMLAICLIVQAVIACAIFRTTLGRPETSFGALRFGTDELLQVAAGVIFFLLFIAIEIAWEIVGLVIGGVLAFALGMMSQNLAALGVAVGVLIMIGGIIWTVTRLSLFGVQTFDEKNLNMFGSWKLTKGNSLTLFLGYVIAFVMMFLVEFLCAVIFIAVVFAVTGGHFVVPTPGPDMAKQVATLAVPVIIAFAVLMFVLMPLVMAIFIGAPAAAYKALSGAKPKTADAVF